LKVVRHESSSSKIPKCLDVISFYFISGLPFLPSRLCLSVCLPVCLSIWGHSFSKVMLSWCAMVMVGMPGVKVEEGEEEEKEEDKI